MGRYGSPRKVRYAPRVAAPPVPAETLVRRPDVSDLVRVFSEAEADVRALFVQATAIEGRLAAVFSMGERDRKIRVNASNCHHNTNWEHVEDTIASMRKAAWQCIVQRLELRRTLSIVDAKALDRRLEEGPWPPITTASMHDVLGTYTDVAKNFDRAMREVFDWLRPPSRSKWGLGRLKTNQIDVVGASVILSALKTGSRSVDHYFRANLVSLERVFLVLDGQGYRVRGYVSDLEMAIDRAPHGETEFFAYRCHYNGHLHLRFRRLDLLATFNARCGGMTLPEAPAAPATAEAT